MKWFFNLKRLWRGLIIAGCWVLFVVTALVIVTVFKRQDIPSWTAFIMLAAILPALLFSIATIYQYAKSHPIENKDSAITVTSGKYEAYSPDKELPPIAEIKPLAGIIFSVGSTYAVMPQFIEMLITEAGGTLIESPEMTTNFCIDDNKELSDNRRAVKAVNLQRRGSKIKFLTAEEILYYLSSLGSLPILEAKNGQKESFYPSIVIQDDAEVAIKKVTKLMNPLRKGLK